MDNNKSKFVQGLLQALHIVEFGILGLVCCIPVITAGAATSAMFRMFFNMRQGEKASFKEYFNEFGKLFRNATIIELTQIASGAFIALMAVITFRGSSISSAGMLLLAPVSLLFLIWILVFAYVYAHEAYFRRDIKSTFKECFVMTFGCLLCTTALLILLLIIPMLYLLMPDLFVVLLPVWLILLMPLISWWDSYFYIKAFTDFESEGTKAIRSSEEPQASENHQASEEP